MNAPIMQPRGGGKRVAAVRLFGNCDIPPSVVGTPRLEALSVRGFASGSGLDWFRLGQVGYPQSLLFRAARLVVESGMYHQAPKQREDDDREGAPPFAVL
ncbi:hypothetical protein [Novosphingobium sp. PhB165]|uniref:hypothetical protein n=1 Tax=Novosphingobium sp. PhB165 TaxID=2485105 RepID=UPI001043E82C|nr:hypothetical protein [Novosphingobium sp. PhB165]